MAQLLLGLALLLLLLLAAHAFARMPTRAAARWVRAAVVLLALALALLLLFKGPAMLAALPAAVGLAVARLARPALLGLLWRRLAGAARAGPGPAPGGGAQGASEVRGKLLRMTLDHATGAMEGEVLQGPLAGRRLASLDEEELRALHRACAKECERSLRLLEGWLDRHLDADWRARFGPAGGPPPRAGPMTREEALQVLGLGPGATPGEIRAAHRRLSRRLHPDAGGTDRLAALINEARAVLLGGDA